MRARREGPFSYLAAAAALLLCFAFLIGACAPKKPYATKGKTARLDRPKIREKAKRAIPRLGFTVQAGAFKSAQNAARFTETLKEKGLDATYFVTDKGLYRVTFGNWEKREDAETLAVILRSMGVIEDFQIVRPEDYAVAKARVKGETYLRGEIVKTSRTFLGVPYLWGGTNAEEGFDCSGLTMTVYRLNGLDLPRTSVQQFEAGEAVDREELQRGDLVFFATAGGRKVSHVGIYIGGDRFIHAPGRGKRIRVDSLDSSYYAKRYLGARTYI